MSTLAAGLSAGHAMCTRDAGCGTGLPWATAHDLAWSLRNLIDGVDSALRKGENAVLGRTAHERWVAAAMGGGMAFALAPMVPAA